MSGLRPVRVAHGSLAAIVAPDGQDVQQFALADALVTAAAAVAIAALAFAFVLQFQRAANKQLEVTLEERRTAAAEFQRFLADAGHELRTPLTIVSGYLDILSARATNDDGDARILAAMRAEAARMRGLVEKMLLLARLETPISVPRLVDPAQVAHDVAGVMQARFPDRSIDVREGDAASLVIDYDDLYECLRNLVDNALRYAPDSPVTIETAVESGRAVVRVIDRGPGIRPEEREAIFERFYRGRNSAESEGSGLGLAIVKRVATRWNGDVDLASGRDGTTFTLRFPLADEEIHDVLTR
jgi:two-component system OmpR family sensor kinase